MLQVNETAARLRSFMEYRDVSRREFAAMCGTNQSAVNNWIIGANTPRVANMIKLREATGVSLDWIYCGAGEMPAKAELLQLCEESNREGAEV